MLTCYTNKRKADRFFASRQHPGYFEAWSKIISQSFPQQGVLMHRLGLIVTTLSFFCPLELMSRLCTCEPLEERC